jgi:uncharacterized protein DUF4129
MRAAGRGGFPRGWPRGPGGPVARLAAAVMLLVLAALGSAAREVSHLSTAGMLASARPVTVVAGVIVVAAGCLVLAGVLIMLARRRRRRRQDEFAGVAERVGPWWARALALLAGLALFALPIAAVVVAVRGRHGGWRPAAPALVVPAVPHLPGPAPSPGGTGGAVVLLVVVAAVTAAAVAALWLRRRLRATNAPHRHVAAPSPLAVAVAAGSPALGATAGAREAIIACYAAMEDALAAAGSPRRLADTPEELLNRAVGSGIVRTPAARRLTSLFREARFSPHELAEAQRHAARSALDDIGHDVAGGP